MNQNTNNSLQEYRELSQDVEGFFHPKHAGLWDIFFDVQRQLAITGNLMEIGVLHGKSAIMIILHMDSKRERVDLVDIELRPTLRKTIDKFSVETQSKVKFLIGDSKKTITPEFVQTNAAAYRWIHIDGEHSYDGVYSDLRNADTLLSDDGLICCDDFLNPRYLQITDAVFRYVYANSDRLSFLVVGHNKGYLCRPKTHQKYYSRIQTDFAISMALRGVECEVFKCMINGFHCIGMR